ncbi:transcriptional regulator, LacI family [Massilia sp. PDC64]|nr:LacI family DNA-binding transcriptional regulator [Massilia sp. PDC64]SDE79735.1 transcriptional regulator, LacI family [Massilia sp. PDC64]
MNDQSDTHPRKRRPTGGVSTLERVAQEAGVSMASASRAFSNPGRVSLQTAQRVKEAAARLGYYPNLIAGGLASQKSRIIGLLVPTIEQSIFSATIQALTDKLAAEGFHVMIGQTGLHDEHLADLVGSMVGHRPSGVIVTGVIESDDLRDILSKSHIPIIETWDLPAQPIDMAVGFSHEAVGREIGRFLIESRYRRPFVATATGIRASARHRGLAACFLESGREAPPFACYEPPTSITQGRAALAHVLESERDTDVIVCSSDWMALGVIAEAGKRNLRVPQDIAVIGFGNSSLVSELEPALTTIGIDGGAIATEAVSLLLKKARGETSDTPVVDVGYALLRRGSA